MELPDILKKIDLEAFDLWRTFESFMVVNGQMPVKLREYFMQLESYILQSLSWGQGSSVVKICKDLQQEKLQPGATMISLNEVVRQEQERAAFLKPYNIFFKRVLHNAALRVSEMC